VKGSLYALVYAAVLGAVCALLLTGAADFTEDARKANAEAEEVLNIVLALKVVPSQGETSFEQLVEIHERMSSEQLSETYDKISNEEKLRVYEENVRQQQRGGITTYVYSPPQAQGKSLAIAMRFSGPGLWAPIKGFLALKPDMKTIVGITFYEQEETPGLGGEIVTEGFRKRFVGKTIHDKDDNVGIVICKPGSAKEQNEIDGITGATMTCDKVQAMLNEAIKSYESIVEEKQ